MVQIDRKCVDATKIKPIFIFFLVCKFWGFHAFMRRTNGIGSWNSDEILSQKHAFSCKKYLANMNVFDLTLV